MGDPETNGKRVLSPKERRQRNRQEMMTAILDAARSVMREEGVAALNLHEVARRVGLRAPSLYEYFPGKMALYDAVYRFGIRLYAAGRERLAPITAHPASFWEHARAELEHYMTFAQENPELYQLVFEHPVPGFVPSSESLEEGARILAHSDQILKQALEQGTLALGLNFSWYDPQRVERVEAVEPDSAMLAYARERAGQAVVPITLTQASVEALPWDSATFDCAVATLVFCSVSDPVWGLAEIKRVLKPGGTLFLFEHVRSQTAVIAQLQDALVPVTTRLFGNCHWNRDAHHLVREAGFQVVQVRSVGGGLTLMPHLLLEAQRKDEEKEGT